MSPADEKKTMRVQLFRSMHGRLKTHQACVRGLGLRRMHQVVEVEDTPATRGMVNRVAYMVREVAES
jgi:large subunit ribosomal protein L30